MAVDLTLETETIASHTVADWKKTRAEVFVPLAHPPGEAQVDFGRAEVVVAGVRHKAALFVLTLPHSNARFGCLFPRECTETFHEGHARAFISVTAPAMPTNAAVLNVLLRVTGQTTSTPVPRLRPRTRAMPRRRARGR